MRITEKKKYSVATTISRFTFIFIIAFVLASPVLADPCKGVDSNGNRIPAGCTVDVTTKTNPDVTTNTGTGVKVDTGITNPIAGIDNIPAFILAILNFVLIVGIPIITLAIIYSGFLFVTAQGNTEKLGKAKKALMYTLIGAALMLGSFVLTTAIKGTVDCIGNTNNGVKCN